MRTQTNIALRAPITTQEIERILSLRRTYEAQKKRLEMAENALIEAEQVVMSRVQSGASIICTQEIQIRAIERRNVAWKSVCAELLGAEATENILNGTSPSISYRLIIKEAA